MAVTGKIAFVTDDEPKFIAHFGKHGLSESLRTEEMKNFLTEFSSTSEICPIGTLMEEL